MPYLKSIIFSKPMPSIRIISTVFGLLVALLLATGCMPRGETITLDQSLDVAKERYSNAVLLNKEKVPPDVMPSLENIRSSLDRLASVTSEAGYQQESKIISDSLKPLVTKAGYTSRLSLDEIVKQYDVAANQSVKIDFAPGTAKLLAQRTYHVISAELESTRFSL